MNPRRGRRSTGIRWPAPSLLLPLALILAVMPQASANGALQGDENSYTDPAFGWSIAWDPATWTMQGSLPTPPNADDVAGNEVVISGLDPSAQSGVIIGSHASFDDDLAACLDATTEHLAEIVGLPIAEAREAELPLPDAPDEAEQRLSIAHLSGSGTEVDVAIYVECRPLVEGEAVLSIGWVLMPPDSYEPALPVFEELIAGLDLSDVAAAGAGADEETETYTDPLHGWSIDYDPRTWSVEAPRQQFEDDAAGNRVMTSSGAGFFREVRGDNVYIIGDTAHAGDTAACLDATRQSETVGTTDVSDAELDPPRAPADAEWALLLVSSSGFQSVKYIECRPLVEGEAVLSIVWYTEEPDYEAALPGFEALIAGLDLSEVHPPGEGPSGEDGDKETFEEPTYGWSIDFDPATWILVGPTLPILADAGEFGNAVLFGGTDVEALGNVLLAADTLFGDDPAACMEALGPETFQGQVSASNVREADLDLPDAPADAERRLYLFTGTYVDVTGDSLAYVECRPLVEGEAVLAIAWILPDAARYDEELPDFEELIAGLDLSEVHPAGE